MYLHEIQDAWTSAIANQLDVPYRFKLFKSTFNVL